MRIYIIDYIGFTLGITEGNIYKYHYLVLFMEKSLNENDRKLLAICSKESSIGEIAKQLNISPKNVSVRLKKLLDLKLISIRKLGKGRRTFVRTSASNKTKEYQLEILKKIKERGGEVSFNDYANLPGYNPDFFTDPNGRDKATANTSLIYSGLIERVIRLTAAGKKFLDEQSKDLKVK